MAVGYGQGGNWLGMGNNGLLSSEDAVETGLGGALNIIQNANRINYPGYVPSQQQAPSQQAYYNYTQNAPMGRVTTPNYTLNNSQPTWKNTNLGSYNVNAPTANTQGYNWQTYGQNAPQYQGLMGGDYNRLEQALAAPGQIAAQNAYNTSSRDLNNAMGGRGLYGSSIMGTQANEGLNREYMNAMASNAANAATNRYGMQQEDLANASGQQMQGWQSRLGESNAANQARLGYAELGTKTNLANAANQLSAAQSNQGAQMDLNKLAMQQGLAQNQQGLDVYKQQMNQTAQMNEYNLTKAAQQMTQEQNLYNAGVGDAARQQEYAKGAMEYANTGNENLRNWSNAQNLEKFQYDLAAAQYGNQQNTQLINQYLALAGYGAPLAGQQSAANNNNMNGWLQALGGFLGNYGG